MEEFNLERFKMPDSVGKPIYTWVWNGRLSKETIKKQLEDMKKRDIHSFYILPLPPTFRPNEMYSEFNVVYMGDEFLEYVRYTAECASELDMTMWLYDEPGWPSGNAGSLVVEKDASTLLKWIEKRECLLQANEIYYPAKDVVASYCGQRIKKGFQSEEDTIICEYYLKSDGRITYVDCLEKRAIELFLETTYEEYKKCVGQFFGNLIPCMFTDEPAIAYVDLDENKQLIFRPAWSYDFTEKFVEKYGYDIRDYMPALLGEEITNEKERIARIHHNELATELFAERYFGQIRAWCNKNNVKFAGHLGGDHQLQYLVKVGNGYIMRTLRQFDIPGIDTINRQIYPSKTPCKEGYAFFPRLASSAASQNGTKDALSECFGVYGSGMSFDTMRYVVNYQMIRGINIYNFMVMGYGQQGALSSQSRPSMDREAPQSEYYKQFHDYIARTSYLLTLGASEADTALYIPVRDIFAGDEYEEKADRSFQEAGNYLEKLGVDFDLIDDSVIREAKRKDNALEIGLARYKNIVIPKCKYVPEDVREKLKGINSDVHCDLFEDNQWLRSKIRLLDDGKKIILIFNENTETVEEKIYFPIMQYLYELDLMNGEVLACEYDRTVCFYGGELKAFLVSDVQVQSRKPYIEVKRKVLDKFIARPISTTKIGEKGIHKEVVQSEYQEIELGQWEQAFGKEFSGEVSYRTEFEVEEDEGEVYCINLGRVDVAAKILLNGKEYGLCTLHPKQLLIPYGEMPKGKVSLEIIVANTMANQYAFADYEKYYSIIELGTYHQLNKNHERDEACGGLNGPVTISLLKKIQ